MSSDADTAMDALQKEMSVINRIHSVFQDMAVEEEKAPEDRSDPLFAGSEITEAEVLLMILALGLRHNLSYATMKDVMYLIKILSGRDDLKLNKYFLLKHCEPERSDELYHFFCPECTSYLGSVGQIENNITFHCICGHVLTNLRKVKSFFMTLGLKGQLQQLFKNPEVVENIDYRFNRSKEKPENIEDKYDGLVYHRLCQDGQPLSNRNNFSITFNTDGYPIGNSSVQEGWPIFVSLNELPPKLRDKHTLLVGMWVGKSPDMQLYLQPFVNEVNDVATNGFTWNRNGQEVKSLVIPTCCCVDSQARWKVLNMKACTGYQACTICEHPGDHTPLGARYKLHLDRPRNRTDDSLRQHMIKAYRRMHIPVKNVKDRIVKGVKGISGLFNMIHFDLVDGMPPDAMHLVKGVVEKHLNLFVKFYVDKDNIVTLDNRIGDLCPPSIITRSARLLKDIKKFKCSEFRSYCLFYNLIVFMDIVPQDRLAHFGLLSYAIFLLMQKSISEQQLELASELIVTYVFLFEEFYGETSMCLNVHLLLHLITAVRNQGPLWTISCYSFEGLNGSFMSMQKSACHVTKEIVRKFKLFKNLPNISRKINASEKVLDFVGNLSGRSLKFFVRGDKCVLLGKAEPYSLTAEEENCIVQSGIDIGEDWKVTSFCRMLCKEVRFTTYSYCEKFKRNDSVIYMSNTSMARISQIVKVNNGQGTMVLVFAHELVQGSQPLFRCGNLHISHIKKVLRIGQLLLLSHSDIQGQCILMSTDKGTYAANVPYGCLGD